MKIDLIIPVYDLRRRGLNRVLYSCESLANQTKSVNKVWIVNGSTGGQYYELNGMIAGYPFVEHVHMQQEVFNKPMLLNYAIKNSGADYIIASDADYLFRNDFIETYSKHADISTMLLKKVLMLHQTNISLHRIRKWQWPRNLKYNQFGELANGAAQCATRQWFLDNPYNERMKMLGGMDNLMVYTAEAKGLTIKWVEESQILHQHHEISPMKWNKQFNINQSIINEELNKLK